MIDGLKPQNEAEAMLAAQIAATHDRVMSFSARLGRGDLVQEQDFCFLDADSFTERSPPNLKLYRI